MKKFAILLMVVGLFIFCSNDVYARAIGVKINYNKMMGDYADAEFDNNVSGGVFFDMDRWGFQSMDFRPGIDFVKFETEAGEWATVYGIHFDWYWFFQQKGTLAPFVGFGPALNYFIFEEHNSNGVGEDDDSDAGIEGFGGVEYKINNQFTLVVELRLVLHDIANWDQQIFKPSIGISYRY